MSQVRQSSLFGGLLHVLQALTKVVALFLESLKDLFLCVLLQSLGNASILQTKNLKIGQLAFSFQMTNSYPPSKKFKMDAIKTFIAMSCDCIFPRDPFLEHLHLQFTFTSSKRLNIVVFRDWEIPDAYFLLPSLPSSERTQSQAKVFWLVFDAGFNISTIRASFSFSAVELFFFGVLALFAEILSGKHSGCFPNTCLLQWFSK